MGEAADDLWDAVFSAQMDLALMVSMIRETCERGFPSQCQIVASDPADEADDWLPYRCKTCGRSFDYP